jgi:hypothetical protein
MYHRSAGVRHRATTTAVAYYHFRRPPPTAAQLSCHIRAPLSLRTSLSHRSSLIVCVTTAVRRADYAPTTGTRRAHDTSTTALVDSRLHSVNMHDGNTTGARQRAPGTVANVETRVQATRRHEHRRSLNSLQAFVNCPQSLRSSDAPELVIRDAYTLV